MRSPASGLRACALTLAVLTPSLARADDADLAAKAQAVLKANCYRCHGQDGNSKGGFGYVLDRNQLVNRGKVVPGKPDESELLQRVEKGEMPPETQKARP